MKLLGHKNKSAENGSDTCQNAKPESNKDAIQVSLTTPGIIAESQSSQNIESR